MVHRKLLSLSTVQNQKDWKGRHNPERAGSAQLHLSVMMTVSFQSYCIDHADDVRILAAVKRTMTDFGSVSCPVADRHSPNSALEDQQSREVADSTIDKRRIDTSTTKDSKSTDLVHKLISNFMCSLRNIYRNLNSQKSLRKRWK